jgi:hypothetical protein
MTRTHREILNATNMRRLARAIGVKPTLSGVWASRDSIPGSYWKALADEGFATLEELADAADRKRRL